MLLTFAFTESNHRLLLEFNAKKDRCLEELELLKRDMESYLTFYTSKITTELKIDHLASSDSERVIFISLSSIN